MHPVMLALVVAAVGASLTVGGCASEPSRFYLLSAMPGTGSAASAPSGQHGPTIGVGPVTLPRYVDRPQIAARTGPYEITLAEFDRWAEGLDANFSRVLAENLALLLPSARVVMSPWPRATPIDYQIMVDVTQFLGQVGGECLLIADWTIVKGEGEDVLASGRSRFSASAAGKDYAAIVAAMSQTVASLSQELASTIRGMGAKVSTRTGVSGEGTFP
jgi:uncharacterized lipoprotein YmbA